MRKIKYLSLCLIAILITCSANLGFTTVLAEERILDEADICFIDAFNLMSEDEMELESYERQGLYDYNLEHSGYAYSISVSGNLGFALMIMRAGSYEVTELYFNRISPYKNIAGLAIYLTPFSYIEFIDDNFIDIKNDVAIEEETLLTLSKRGFGFKGGIPGQVVTETVTYTSRTVEVPAYYNTNPAITNCCAVDAGSVLIGYYSRYYPELTPGFVVGRVLGSSYFYYGQGSPSKIQNVINDLYNRMETNVGSAGTTASGFRNGLSTYVAAKGKTVTYTNVVNNNTLNYNAYEGHIANAKPVVIFLNTYNLLSDTAITTIGNTDSIQRQYYSGMHVMIGFGHKKVMYYNGSTNFRTDYYVKYGYELRICETL